MSVAELLGYISEKFEAAILCVYLCMFLMIIPVIASIIMFPEFFYVIFSFALTCGLTALTAIGVSVCLDGYSFHPCGAIAGFIVFIILIF